MESNKFSKPCLPTTQQILEDIIDQNIVSEGLTKRQISEDSVYENIHLCYNSFQQLESDLLSQKELIDNLSVLKQKLNDNINDIKKPS